MIESGRGSAGCPSMEMLAALVEGTLAETAAQALRAHTTTCGACVSLLTVARSRGPISAPGTAAALCPGSRIGRYEVRAWLGAGAMGVVYEAYDPELDRAVAVKTLKEGALGILGEEAGRMAREARAMARLTHPNVVTVYDVGIFEGKPFVAMELVRGGTLREWLMRKHEPREILDAFMKAGRGLAAAHDAGIVHRDFKPDNVLVGDDGRVMVTDFGLARAARVIQPGAAEDEASRPVSSRNLTGTGWLIGTPAYMAPEQAEGVSDARSDIFAFSTSLYEALYGVRPFGGATMSELHASVRAGHVVTPIRDVGVAQSLRRSILRGLAAKPEERWPTMRSLLDDVARPPEERLARRVPSRWLLVGTAALSVAAGVVGGGVLLGRNSAPVGQFDHVLVAAPPGRATEAPLYLAPSSVAVLASSPPPTPVPAPTAVAVTPPEEPGLVTLRAQFDRALVAAQGGRAAEALPDLKAILVALPPLAPHTPGEKRLIGEVQLVLGHLAEKPIVFPTGRPWREIDKILGELSAQASTVSAEYQRAMYGGREFMACTALGAVRASTSEADAQASDAARDLAEVALKELQKTGKKGLRSGLQDLIRRTRESAVRQCDSAAEWGVFGTSTRWFPDPFDGKDCVADLLARCDALRARLDAGAP